MKKTLLFYLLFAVYFILPNIINGQSITNISPNVGQQGQSLNVTISTSGAGWNYSNTTFRLIDDYSNTIMGYNTYFNWPNLQGNINIPLNQQAGLYNVQIQMNNGGWISSNVAFNVTPAPPTILNVSPNQSEQGQNLTLSIISNNINYGDYSATTSPFRLIQPSSNSIINVNETYVVAEENEDNSLVEPVLFTFYARGDLGSYSEFFEVYDENNQLLTQINGVGGDCWDEYDYVYYSADINQVSSWLMDGVLNFRFQASYAVDGFCDFTNVGVSFNYGGVNYEQTIQIYEYDIQYYPTFFTFYLNNNYTTLNGDINIANNQSPGTYDLEVYDFDTESWVLAESIFTIYEPTSLDDISPDSAFQGQSLNVAISGTNMSFVNSFYDTLQGIIILHGS